MGKLKSNEKFLIIDSISALLIYNTPSSVKECLTPLITTLRLLGMAGIVITTNETPKELEQLLMSMSDNLIRLGN